MLPATLPLDAYRPFRRDIDAQRPAMEMIAARHGLPRGELAPLSQGTQVVWRTERSVIKLFVPTWPEDARIEMGMLERLVGTGLPVPQLEAGGEVAGWPYVVMNRLPGRTVPEAWPGFDADARARLAHDIGAAMASRRAARDRARRVARPAESLLAERRPRLLQDQRDRGGDDALEAELQAFLDTLPPLLPAESVLLHADLTGTTSSCTTAGFPDSSTSRTLSWARGRTSWRHLLLRDAGRSALAARAPFGPWRRGDARAPRHAALLGRAPPLRPRREDDAERRPREPAELARHTLAALIKPSRPGHTLAQPERERLVHVFERHRLGAVQVGQRPAEPPCPVIAARR
jgi:hypothetical protein